MAEIESNDAVPLSVRSLAIVTGVNVTLEYSSLNVISFASPYAEIVTVGLTAATVYNENEFVKHEAITSLVPTTCDVLIPSNICHSEVGSLESARMHWQYAPSAKQSAESSGIVSSTGEAKLTERSAVESDDVILYSMIDVFVSYFVASSIAKILDPSSASIMAVSTSILRPGRSKIS